MFSYFLIVVNWFISKDTHTKGHKTESNHLHLYTSFSAVIFGEFFFNCKTLCRSHLQYQYGNTVSHFVIIPEEAQKSC